MEWWYIALQTKKFTTMSSLLERYREIRAQIPASVKLVAVSKTYPAADIQTLYNAGQIVFGENRVQEWMEKHPGLPADIEWHLIGHLQSNKARFIFPGISWIHSIDSPRLLAEVSKSAVRQQAQVNVLLQVHIASEETKFGLSPEELKAWCHELNPDQYPNISIRGLMGMATFTSDTAQVRREFKSLKNLSDEIRMQFPDWKEISMGMSGDFRIAIEEGATLVRIGSTIFGKR